MRHIERTRLLVHLVGDEAGAFDPDDMLYKYDLVRQELATYSDVLAAKPEIVVISKIDLGDEATVEATRAAFRARGIEPLAVSAMTGEGLEGLPELLGRRIRDLHLADGPTSQESAKE